MTINPANAPATEPGVPEVIGAEAHRAIPVAAGAGWPLWRRQLTAILRIELRRTLFSRRAILLYLMALLPVLAILGFSAAPLSWRDDETIGFANTVFAGIFQGFLLRFLLFFGCVWLFSHLFRGELLDRSLHYYFLAPVRRTVLVVGKFLAALISTSVLFGGATLVSYLLLYVPYGFSGFSQHFLSGPGKGQLFAYLGITVLACLGYGAVFLLVGVLFKNPILPAVFFLILESVGFLLPPLLKKLTVSHYLKGLMPVAIPESPFALLADPPPPLLSIFGLLLFTAIVLAAAGYRVGRMEIDYGED